jgi:hypothetical protein
MTPCRSLPALLVVAALAGCATVSLEEPPRPPPVVLPRPIPAPAPAAAVPSTAPAQAAQAAPVLPPTAPAPVPLAEPERAPYGPAVAARFPDPPIDYATPAFAPGHAGYTSNAELRAALADLVRAADARPAGPRVRLLALGASQNNVPLEALLLTGPDVTGVPTRRAGDATIPARPTVVLVGQQHGDEPAGAEALLVIAQRLVRGPLQTVLDRLNVVVYPRANPDGADAGRRTTANGIDVNRDHLLLRTPEAQAQAVLVREFAPLVVVDAHEYSVVSRYIEKFGAIQRFDALLQYATTANIPPFVTRASEEWFHQPAVAALRAAGLTSEWYYTTTTDIGDRKVSMGGTQPDTGRNVDGLTNAVSILVETRGVGIGRLHLKRRVHTHVVAISSILESAAARAADLEKLRDYVDKDVARMACTGDMVVEAGPTPSEHQLLMLDPVTGADKPVTVAWDSALELRPITVRPRPCGYWLSDREGESVRRLRALGIQVLRLDQDGELRGEEYREIGRDNGPRQDVRGPLAGEGDVLRVHVQLVPTLLDVKAGSYYVPLDQPLGNLAVAALEPDTQNSYYANGVLARTSNEARVLARPELRSTPVP